MALNPHTEQRLLALLDERDIHAVLTRYCQGVDRCDAGLIASCYHEDARDDHGSWTAWGRDVAELIVDKLRPGPASSMHFLGNVQIEVQGDTGFAESYLLAFRAFERDGLAYTRTRALRFVDRFSRRLGQWRIAERVVADDWNRVDEVRETLEESGQLRRGSKDLDDPLYAIRRGQVAREPKARR